MKDLKILLIEDNKAECKAFIDAISRRSGMVLTGDTDESGDAIKLFKSDPPDVVILDLELHQGGGDGFAFLKELNALHLSKPPYIVVTTNNTDTITHTAARNLGAGFIITKPQRGYSADYVLNYINTVQPAILAVQGETAVTSADPDICAVQYEKVISGELLQLGFKPKNEGYKYSCKAILALMEDPDAKAINIVAEANGKTMASVSRAMQNEIDRVWKNGDQEYIYLRYKGYIDKERGAPTVTDFIHYFAIILKNEIS